MRYFCLAVAFLCAATAYGESEVISMKSEYEANEKVVVECQPNIPADAEMRYEWRMDKGLDYYEVEAGRIRCLWPKPGEHWVEVTITTKVMQTIKIPIFPDGKLPEKLEDVKYEIIKVPKSLDMSRYERVFTVKGGAPVPIPNPNPGPGPGPGPVPNPPGPVDGFAGEMRKLLQALPEGVYNKNIALALGENYFSVGSQGADPARNSGWNLTTFVTKVKQPNIDAVVEAGGDLQGWTPFFQGVAKYQADLFAARVLKHGDAAKIAALWTETGEAIKAAAY